MPSPWEALRTLAAVAALLLGAWALAWWLTSTP